MVFEDDEIPPPIRRVAFDELDARNEKYLTPEELATRWRYSINSLANQRSQGVGPGYVKMRGRVLYPLSKIVEYEKLGFVKPGISSHNGEYGRDSINVRKLLRETGVAPSNKRRGKNNRITDNREGWENPDE